MDRCYKLKVLILVLTCMLIPKKLIYSNVMDVNYETKASSIQSKSIRQQNKEVINIKNATRLGYVQDVTADFKTGTILEIIVPGNRIDEIAIIYCIADVD